MFSTAQQTINPFRLTSAGRIAAAAIACGCISLLLVAAYLQPNHAGVATHLGLGMQPCQWLVRTGLPCPACGMTTSFSWLVRGNLAASFYVQPMGATVALLDAAGFWLAGYAAVTGNPAYRLLERIPSKYYLIVLPAWAILAWVGKCTSTRMGSTAGDRGGQLRLLRQPLIPVFFMRSVSRILAVGSLLVFLIPVSCQYFAAVAAVTPQYESARYKGLAHQTVGVMVWADRGISIDWPTIQLDIAGSIQNKLKGSKTDEVKETTFPVEVASIVRFQRDHPEIEAQDITEVAPRLGVSRLIYIEVNDFRTRSAQAIELFRGSIDATLKVIEVEPVPAGGQGPAHAKIAFQEELRAIFPKKSQPEGSIDGQDYPIYLGTIDSYSDSVIDTLTTHLIN